MRKLAPWTELSGTVIEATEVHKRKAWVNYCSWMMCAFLLVGGIISKMYVACVFGLLYIMVLIMQKSVVATERGIEIFHEMVITTNYELLSWKDIHAIAQEENPKYPDYTVLYFTKGDRTKRMVFYKKDVEEVYKLARKGNAGLRIQKNK